MTTLTAIVTGMQTFHRAISGVVSAPAAMPSQINPAVLPMVVTIPGEATWNEHAVGLQRQSRDMIVRVFVAPIATGAGVDTGFQTSVTLIQAFADAYLDDTTLGGIVEQILDLRDTGVDGRLMWGGSEYRGFEFHLQVVNKG